MIDTIESHQQTQYACILVRLSKFYLFLIIAQFLLATVIIYSLYTKHDLLIEIAQTLSALLIIIDLVIRRFSQAKMFLGDKHNWIDIGILIFLLVTIATRYVFSQRIYHEDSIVGAFFIIVRYLLQIYRMVSLFRKSKQLTRLTDTEIIDIKLTNSQNKQLQYQQPIQNTAEQTNTLSNS